MPFDIVVPPLSQTSDTLVFLNWLKRVGDPVIKGEALFEVETDKATLEVEAPASGTLLEALAEPGTEVVVKSRIGSIGVPEAEAAVAAPPAPRPTASKVSPARQAAAAPHPDRADRLLASPRARRLADSEGIALGPIQATGPRGLIVERDVRAYLAVREGTHAPPAESAPGALPPAPVVNGEPRRVPLSPTRRTIARRLQTHQQAAVPVTLTREVDATELVALRERLVADLAEQAVRPTYTDLLVSIAARCLARHAGLNGTFDGEALSLHDAVHMGLAVDTERGLVVPVLRDAGSKGLTALASERVAAVARAQAGTVTPEELAGGTFTLTNLGALGIDAFTPVLNPPQIAILGVGRIRPVVAPVGDGFALRQAMVLSLTFDHRAVDGAPAARLLVDIARLVERPERVWL